MKRILMVFLLLYAGYAFGQTTRYNFPHLVAGIIFEETINGPYLGLYTGVNISKLVQLGGFYEQIVGAEDNPYNENLNMWGAYGQVALIQEERIGVHLQLRGGYQNDKFVLLVPNLLTEVAINEWFHLNLSAGVRNEYPSIGLLAQFNIPLKK